MRTAAALLLLCLWAPGGSCKLEPFAKFMRCDACQVLAVEIAKRCGVPKRSLLPIEAFAADVLEASLEAAKRDWHWAEGLGTRDIAVGSRVRLSGASDAGGNLAWRGPGRVQHITPEGRALVRAESAGWEDWYDADDLRRIACRGRFLHLSDLRRLRDGAVGDMPAGSTLTGAHGGAVVRLRQVTADLESQVRKLRSRFRAQQEAEAGSQASEELVALGLEVDRAESEWKRHVDWAGSGAVREHSEIGKTLEKVERQLKDGKKEVDLAFSQYLQELADTLDEDIEDMVTACQRQGWGTESGRVAEKLCSAGARVCSSVAPSYPPPPAPLPGHEEPDEPAAAEEDEGEL